MYTTEAQVHFVDATRNTDKINLNDIIHININTIGCMTRDFQIFVGAKNNYSI